jgi:hypothetical protein
VGVLQASSDAHLALEAIVQRRGSAVLPHDLDRDHAIVTDVASGEHLRHPTGADRTLDDISLAKGIAKDEGHHFRRPYEGSGAVGVEPLEKGPGRPVAGNYCFMGVEQIANVTAQRVVIPAGRGQELTALVALNGECTDEDFLYCFPALRSERPSRTSLRHDSPVAGRRGAMLAQEPSRI